MIKTYNQSLECSFSYSEFEESNNIVLKTFCQKWVHSNTFRCYIFGNSLELVGWNRTSRRVSIAKWDTNEIPLISCLIDCTSDCAVALVMRHNSFSIVLPGMTVVCSSRLFLPESVLWLLASEVFCVPPSGRGRRSGRQKWPLFRLRVDIHIGALLANVFISVPIPLFPFNSCAFSTNLCGGPSAGELPGGSDTRKPDAVPHPSQRFTSAD